MITLQTGMWAIIDVLIIIAVGLLIIWLLVKFTGKHKISRSEVLIERVYHALQDLEDYYDLYPEKQRERNLKIITGIAIDLSILDREAITEKLEKKE